MMDKWKVWCPEISGICINGHNPMMGKDEDGESVRCSKWFKMMGIHPQTGNPVDEFKCLEHWKLIVQTEGNKEIRQSAASTDKVATEVKNHHLTFLNLVKGKAEAKLLNGSKANPS